MDEGMAFTIGELLFTVFKMFDTSTLWLKMFFNPMLLEPIVMEGSAEFKILKDKWTAVSVDDKRYLWQGNHTSDKCK